MLATRSDWAEAPEFHVWVDVTADPPCIGLSGEIDLQTCAAFRDALCEAAEQGSRTIAVDFRRVTFMGSTGMRELARALETVDHIHALSPRPIVRRALEAARLDGVVVYAD
ncbi:MAG: anti-sigma factor antagonist [Acidimicrobiaceae bacterium]|jgi:anti-anti-sigma factor